MHCKKIINQSNLNVLLAIGIAITRHCKRDRTLLVYIRWLKVGKGLPILVAILVCLEESYFDVTLGDFVAQHYDFSTATHWRGAAAQPRYGQFIAFAIDWT